jgi:hypothetical protein
MEPMETAAAVDRYTTAKTDDDDEEEEDHDDCDGRPHCSSTLGLAQIVFLLALVTVGVSLSLLTLQRQSEQTGAHVEFDTRRRLGDAAEAFIFRARTVLGKDPTIS